MKLPIVSHIFHWQANIKFCWYGCSLLAGNVKQQVMQKKIKIMGGGTSLIVPHLCDQLISEGYQVRVVDILDKQVPCEIMKLTENRPS